MIEFICLSLLNLLNYKLREAKESWLACIIIFIFYDRELNTFIFNEPCNAIHPTTFGTIISNDTTLKTECY